VTVGGCRAAPDSDSRGRPSLRGFCQAFAREAGPSTRRDCVAQASLGMTKKQAGIISAQVFSQFAAENLAGSGFRNGIYESNFTRLLVVGEAIGNEAAK